MAAGSFPQMIWLWWQPALYRLSTAASSSACLTPLVPYSLSSSLCGSIEHTHPPCRSGPPGQRCPRSRHQRSRRQWSRHQWSRNSPAGRRVKERESGGQAVAPGKAQVLLCAQTSNRRQRPVAGQAKASPLQPRSTRSPWQAHTQPFLQCKPPLPVEAPIPAPTALTSA